MITRAKFKNFKALRDVEITFDSRLTVLVGPNGSGKTSALQGIHYLAKLAQVANSDPEWQFDNIPDFFSIGEGSEGFQINVDGTRRPETLPYSIGIFTK